MFFRSIVLLVEDDWQEGQNECVAGIWWDGADPRHHFNHLLLFPLPARSPRLKPGQHFYLKYIKSSPHQSSSVQIVTQRPEQAINGNASRGDTALHSLLVAALR